MVQLSSDIVSKLLGISLGLPAELQVEYALSPRSSTAHTDASGPPSSDPAWGKELEAQLVEALTPEQCRKLRTGFALAASSNEAEQGFKKASASAATAVQDIDTMFVNLTARLTSLDDARQFLDTFTPIKKSFRDVVKESHTLAVNIAQYADSFDAIVVKFCADKRLPVEVRIAKIKEFIKDAKRFKKEAGNLNEQFVELKDKFSEFVGSFSIWAKSREAEDSQKIKELDKHIKGLNDQITVTDSRLRFLSAALLATLSITGVVAFLLPPSVPFLMEAGITLAGVELISFTYNFKVKNSLPYEKRVEEEKRRVLQDEISKIMPTRTQLQDEGLVALKTFTDNILVIENVWTKLVNDATEVHLWLQRGANDAKYPEYMRLSLEEGVKVYGKMGKYLRDYANGVTEAVKTF